MLSQTAHKQGCPAITGMRCICNDQPTEMTSLTQIKVSLAALNANHKALKEHLDAIEQSQGKLLAALNEIERAQGAEVQGHQMTREKLRQLQGKLDALGNLLGGLLALARQPRRQGKRKRK